MSIIIKKKLPTPYRQEIKVISWNLDYKNKNTDLKINEIIEKNADILMLQECTSNLKKKLVDYINYDTSKGYNGTINLFIHERINPVVNNIFKDDGLLIYHLNTKYGELIVASIHLPPFNKINDKILRTISIYKVIDFIKKEKLINLPIIIGGYTNMQDDEHIGNLSEDILEDLYDNYGDENNYYTYPNRNNQLYQEKRLDRFFYSRINIKNFYSWSSMYSKYYMLETNITFGNILFDSINTKLEEIKNQDKKNIILVNL